MNNSAGSKKFIKLVAAAGIVTSRMTKTENTQNMPNRALGNLIAAATNAFFSNLSIARIIPSETSKCKTPITLCNQYKNEVNQRVASSQLNATTQYQLVEIMQNRNAEKKKRKTEKKNSKTFVLTV